MKPLTALCALALGVALCGCRSHKEETKVYPDSNPDTVVIEKDDHHHPDTVIIDD